MRIFETSISQFLKQFSSLFSRMIGHDSWILTDKYIARIRTTDCTLGYIISSTIMLFVDFWKKWIFRTYEATKINMRNCTLHNGLLNGQMIIWFNMMWIKSIDQSVDQKLEPHKAHILLASCTVDFHVEFSLCC